MTGVVRLGDINDAGGVAMQASSTVFVNGRGVVWPNAGVSPHPCCGQPGCSIHCSAVTAGGSPSVFVENKPVIRQGDIDTCGHARRTCSPNVEVI